MYGSYRYRNKESKYLSRISILSFLMLCCIFKMPLVRVVTRIRILMSFLLQKADFEDCLIVRGNTERKSVSD